MNDPVRSTLLRYGGAALAVLLATAARLALDPILGDLFPFATLFLAVLVVAGYAGRGPALLATILGALASARFLLPPRVGVGFTVQGFENQAGLVLYLVVGVGIALLGGALREARRRAEADADEAVRQREQLRATLVSIGDAVLVTDAEGRITSLNPVAEGLTGWSASEAAGEPLPTIFRIINETTRQSVENPALRALREGTVVGLANHTLLIARDGTERPIDDSAAPIRDSADRVVGVVLVFRDVTELRSADEARRRLAAIVESSDDAIVGKDLEGTITSWNAAAERLYGYPAAEAVGKPFSILVPPERAAEVEASVRHLREGERLDHFETVRRRKDGRLIDVSVSYSPIHDGQGRLIGTAVIARDDSGRRRAERRRNARLAVTQILAQAADLTEAAPRLLRAICEGLGWSVGALWTADRPAGLLRCLDVWRPPGLAEDFEAATRRMTFGPDSSLPGRVWTSGKPLWMPDVADDERFERRHVAAGAGLHGGFACPVTGDGEVLGVVEFFSHEIREPDPDLLEMMTTLGGQIGQALERWRAEDRLRRSERELADFFENATVGLHWVGPDGIILRANRAELGLLGYAEEEYVGRHIADFHEDEGVICDILRRLRDGETLHDHPARLRCKDGSVKDVLIDSSVLWEDGRFAHTRCFTRDVTEAKRADEALRAAKEEAEAASRAKTQFLAVLSHELRTPLNPIMLAASSMLDRPCDPEGIRPTLEMIRQNVNLQARLIDDLLDVMRIVQGKMPLHWEVADCHRVIEQAIQICQSEVSGHDLRLTVETVARHHHVNADAARLQQVFWNLIKNAVKFTPEGGTITVLTRNESGDGEDRLVVEVSDTGIGIEPEVLPTIWDPFQQGETTITRKFGGLGLGLAICKGVVEAHGGMLEAESPGKDRGTTFRVALKALPEQVIEDNGQPVRDGLTVEPHRPSSLRILVVEDEPATLRLMARLLRGLGHAVTTANSIASGCEVFEAGEFDLIVSDIGLPDGTGLELMRRAVALRGTIPSIALTGYGMEDDIVRSREAGFTAHMTKPIDFTKLEAMIRRVVTGGGEHGPASPRVEGRGK